MENAQFDFPVVKAQQSEIYALAWGRYVGRTIAKISISVGFVP